MVPILERVKGCKAALVKFPGISIVSTQNGKQERDQALTVAENMLQANPDMKGIFSVNDNGSLGVLSAIEASGHDVKLVSVDGAPEAIKAIAKPVHTSLVQQRNSRVSRFVWLWPWLWRNTGVQCRLPPCRLMCSWSMPRGRRASAGKISSGPAS